MSIKNKVTGELSNITTYNASGRISDITLPGNVNAVANVNANALNVTSLSNLGDVGNLIITGGNVGQAIITDGAGNLTWGNAGSTIAAVPAVYFVAANTGNAQTFSNVILGSYTANTDMTVFYNGSLLPSEYYTLANGVMTVNTLIFAGDTIDVITQVAGNVINVTSGYGNSNVTTLLSSGISTNINTTGNVYGSYIIGDGSQLTGLPASYSDSNVEAFLNDGTFTGDFIPGGNATQDLGNATNQWKDLWLSGNTLYMTSVPISLANGNTLQVDGANVVTRTPSGNISANGLTVTGNAVITGNASIQGTLTYNDTTNITTSNLIIGLGNNQSGISVTGGGMVVGDTAEAQFTYNQPAQTWDSNLGIDATGNVTATGNVSGAYIIGDGSLLTGLPASYTNSNVTTLLSGNTVTSNIITTGNVSGTYFLGNGSLLTGLSTGTQDYLQAVLTTDQANVGVGTDLVFNTVSSQSGTSQISLNTTTGVLSLKGGVTYLLTGAPSWQTFTSNTSTYVTYTFVDATTNTPLKSNIIGVGVPVTYNLNENGEMAVNVIYTPPADQTVKLRVTDANGTVKMRGSFSTLTVTQIGATAGATSFTNLAVSGNIVGTNIVSNSGLSALSDLILGNTANTAATKLRLTTFGANSYIQTGNGTADSTGNIVFSPWASANAKVTINTSNGNVTTPAGQLLPATITSPVAGQNIVYDGNAWVNNSSSAAGSWTLTPGVNNVYFEAPINGTYVMYVRGNIPNGIVTWTATATITNTNVPVIGLQSGWYYVVGGAETLQLNSMPAQIIGTAGSIITTNPGVTVPSNRFRFTITNSSGSDQVVYWGYNKQ